MTEKSASTERSSIQSLLKESAELAQALIRSAGTGTYIVQNGKIVYASDLFEELSGYKIEELLETRSLHYVHPDDREMVRKKATESLKGGKILPYEYRFVKKNGDIMWVLERVTSTEYGGKRATVGSFMDITEHKRLEEALKASEERLKILFEFAPDAYYISDTKGTFIDGNKAAEELMGYKREDLIGKNFLKLKLLPATQIPKAAKLLTKNLIGQPTGPDEFTLNHKDGKRVVVDINTYPLKIAGQDLVLGIARDVTNRKRKAVQLTYIATHDPLTGLPNRGLYTDRLGVALNQAKRNRQKLAVMILDLDKFKSINDTLGHGVGDQLLKGVGDRLVALIRKSDTVARLGGDEFIILLPQIGRAENATLTAQKILKGFQKPFVLDNNELSITTSIGIAIYPEGGEDVDALLKHADTAMYRVKEQGRNNYQLWTTQLKLV